eukprot:scaffold6151_cov129-Isochrysis_galbana.AAC.1
MSGVGRVVVEAHPFWDQRRNQGEHGGTYAHVVHGLLLPLLVTGRLHPRRVVPQPFERPRTPVVPLHALEVEALPWARDGCALHPTAGRTMVPVDDRRPAHHLIACQPNADGVNLARGARRTDRGDAPCENRRRSRRHLQRPIRRPALSVQKLGDWRTATLRGSADAAALERCLPRMPRQPPLSPRLPQRLPAAASDGQDPSLCFLRRRRAV